MAMDLEIVKSEKAAPRSKAARPAKIELEVLLEMHREWVQSGGRKGRQADISRLNLEGADLTDTNLRNARLNDTVLKGADLLLSDLEGASLMQANLEGANLLGARLREANLQGANLKGATGLLAAELSGTNLTFAKLPAELSTAEDLKYVARRGRHANWLILALLLLNVLACWRILSVSDAQILRNASSLPLASRRNELPIVQFFLFCPVLLGGLYLWLHVYLQRLWEATAALPAIFENGRRLDASLPWLVRWPAHSYFRWLRARRSALAGIEKATCLLLLYWAVPATMVLFWARYLTLQDVRGTILHILLIAAAVSAAIHFPRSTAHAFGSNESGWPEADSAAADTIEPPSPRRSDSARGSISAAEQGRWLQEALGASSNESSAEPEMAAGDLPLNSSVPVDEAVAELLQSAEPESPEPLEEQPRPSAKKTPILHRIPVGIGFGFILLLLAIGTIGGAPHGGNVAQGIGPASARTWAADAFWLIGYDPFAQVNETEISRKPEGWTGSDDQLGRAEGASMNGIRLRYLQGYGAFFAKARLSKADLRYAYLAEADLRQANLRGASLRFTVLERARLDNVSLQSADLARANLIRASLDKADLSFASLAGTLLLDAKADGAVLYGADLHNAALDRAALGQADLREAVLEGAKLSGTDLHEAYLSSAKMAGAKLDQARLNSAILMSADLRRADLNAANLQSAVLTGADLTGSNLQNADLRGVVGLRAAQLCSAASIRGVQMDDTMAADVLVQCPGSR